MFVSFHTFCHVIVGLMVWCEGWMGDGGGELFVEWNEKTHKTNLSTNNVSDLCVTDS